MACTASTRGRLPQKDSREPSGGGQPRIKRATDRVNQRPSSAMHMPPRNASASPKTQRGPQGGPPPRAPPGACGARGARARTALIEKRPPRARRPALPQPSAAVLSAKAGLTAGFGMGPGDPRLCGRARGGRSPAAQIFEPARSPCRGDPGGRMAGTDRRSRIALGAFHRGCEELGLLVPLG